VSRFDTFLAFQTAQVARMADQIEDISKKAEVTDEAGQWGMDGWIRLFHNLFDMQIRAVAVLIEQTIQGPPWLQPPNPPSDAASAKPTALKPYVRSIDIVESFRRVGKTGPPIDDADITFVPPTLPSGEDEFRIEVPPEHMGFTYVGTIQLCQVSDASGTKPAPEPPQTVTVGL
jgi:hypothetical protein